MVILRIIPLHLVKNDITVDCCKSKITNFLFLKLFTGHFVFHVLGKGAHSLFSDTAVLELGILISDLIHLLLDLEFCLFLFLEHSLVLLLISLPVHFCNSQFFLYWLFFFFSTAFLYLFIEFELVDDLGTEGVGRCWNLANSTTTLR